MSKQLSKKYCPHCGHPVDEDAKFCTHCGYKFSNNSLNTPNRVQRNKSIPSVKQWLKSNKHKWGVGIVAVVLFLCLGTGVYYHQHMATQQQQTTQQKTNQNQNTQNQNNNQPKQTKRQRAEQVTGNFLNDITNFTRTEDKTEEQDPHNFHKFHLRINKGKLSQYYLHGTDNPYYKQMLKWCENQYNNHTAVSAIGRQFHMHHVLGNKYVESYRVYYDFSHDSGSNYHHVYQTTIWHTTVKRIWNDGRYRWFIVKSTSSKHVTRPSNQALIKVGLKNPGQSDNS